MRSEFAEPYKPDDKDQDDESSLDPKRRHAPRNTLEMPLARKPPIHDRTPE